MALSGEALGVLMAMLREYFGASQDEDLKALREIVQESLPEEAKVPQRLGYQDGQMNTCGFSPEGSSWTRTWMS